MINEKFRQLMLIDMELQTPLLFRYSIYPYSIRPLETFPDGVAYFGERA